MDYETRLQHASATRLAFFSTMGSPSKDVLAHLVGPRLTGGPKWPTRPAWRTIQRDETVILATDALSDPWEDRDGYGYGLEVFMEGPGNLLPKGAPSTEIAGTWMFQALASVSNIVAGHGGVRGLLEELGALSVEVDGELFPEKMRNDEGKVGLLLGCKARGIPERIVYGKGQDAMLVAVTALTPLELQVILDMGDTVRTQIARDLAACPSGHVCDFDRECVVAKGGV